MGETLKLRMCEICQQTSHIESIDEFFKNVFQEQKEPLTQLKRRCGTHFELTRQEIRVSMYDNEIQDYKYKETIKNPISNLYPVQPLTDKMATDKLKGLLGDNLVVTSTDDFMMVEAQRTTLQQRQLYNIYNLTTDNYT